MLLHSHTDSLNLSLSPHEPFPSLLNPCRQVTTKTPPVPSGTGVGDLIIGDPIPKSFIERRCLVTIGPDQQVTDRLEFGHLGNPILKSWPAPSPSVANAPNPILGRNGNNLDPCRQELRFDLYLRTVTVENRTHSGRKSGPLSPPTEATTRRLLVPLSLGSLYKGSRQALP